jgi:Tannase and feruloyl esterase
MAYERKSAWREICVRSVAVTLWLAFSFALAARAHAASLQCSSLGSDPSAGLIGNPTIQAISAKIIEEGTPATDLGLPPGVGPPLPWLPGQEPRHVAYCRVQFTYSARAGSSAGYAQGQAQHITIAVALPLNSTDGGRGGIEGNWNGKLENLGGGGCGGVLEGGGSLTIATDAGYVGSTTDTGHTDSENGARPNSRCNFGVIQAAGTLNTGMIKDFIYDAVHEQVKWAVALSKVYYGTSPLRNYWNGCSTGGRQGLALAQEDGAMFDGLLIGAPAVYWETFRLADDWPALVVKDRLNSRGKSLSASQFLAATQAAVAACDVQGLDTVRDGIIDDPRACNFSAAAIMCGVRGAPSAPDCLDADQAAAIDQIWDGPRNHAGSKIWYGYDRGVVGDPYAHGFERAANSAEQVLAYNHADLSFSAANLFLDQKSIAESDRASHPITYENEALLGSTKVGDLMNTQNPNLTQIKQHGAKIIMWHGTSDPAIRWTQSLDYYRRVATYFGDGKANFDRLQSWFRYYHAPGVAHCGGGTGPQPVAMFDDLVNWVEKNVEPTRILAKGGTGNAERSRPLCPWPKTAIYRGSGSTDDAKNFFCGGDLDANPSAVCKMLHTKYKHEDQAALDAESLGLRKQICK